MRNLRATIREFEVVGGLTQTVVDVRGEQIGFDFYNIDGYQPESGETIFFSGAAITTTDNGRDVIDYYRAASIVRKDGTSVELPARTPSGNGIDY